MSVPLERKISYSFSDDPVHSNTIDFTRYVGCSPSTPELVVTPTSHFEDSFTTPVVNATQTSTYRFANATSPVILIISCDERCSVLARFFAFRLYHFFCCSGESIRMMVAAASFYEHRVPLFANDPKNWKIFHQKCMDETLQYFDSNPVLGSAATPVALIYGDTMSPGALNAFVSLLPPGRQLLRRHIWFSEGATDQFERLSKATCGWIHACLRRKTLRLNSCHGSVVCSQVTFFLTNILRLLHRIYENEPIEGDPLDTLQSFCPTFFIRHGQSQYNLEDRLGGDPDLTEAGLKDAEDLREFFQREVVKNPKLFGNRCKKWDEEHGFEVWCSQLQRTLNTARPSSNVLTQGKVRVFKSLNEIHAGICEDMTNDEISSLYPYIHHFRATDKVGFRYPNGESYRDLLRRLTPLVLQLCVSDKCTLVVGHQAVLRSMLSFFGGSAVDRAVHEPCPQRAIWVCTWNRVGEPRLTEISLPPRKEKTSVNTPKWTGW